MDHDFLADWNDRAIVAPAPAPDYRRRALFIWPGLDRHRLRLAHNDPLRIARLVARGTKLPIESILVQLLGLR